MSALFVVVDIGGTNTRCGLCDGVTLHEDSIRRYRNADHPGIAPILQDFLSHTPGSVEAICIDMAGPVDNGLGTLTNLDWVVDSKALSKQFGAPCVEVLNDLQAQGHAVPYFTEKSYTCLRSGAPSEAGASRLVVNVGTGLNAVPVHSLKGETLVPAAEAGHARLQGVCDEEIRLIDFIAQTHPQPGLEEILSGRGLERLYGFACHESGRESDLQAADIMQEFLDGGTEAQRAVALFTRYLGRYCGDLALSNLPFGGIYLVGGVARHLGPHLMAQGFEQAFEDKGRFSDYMRQFPIHLVTDDYAALCGCAGHLAEVLHAAQIQAG